MSDNEVFPLKRPPKHGVYLRWPENGTEWIHPDDVTRVEAWIPSCRIFRREDLDAEYCLLAYAGVQLRVRPTMWLEVPSDGYEVGDQVEIKSQWGRREPAIATIRDIFWNPQLRQIEYHLFSCEREMRSPYTLDEFQPAFKLDGPMTRRQLELVAKHRLH